MPDTADNPQLEKHLDEVTRMRMGSATTAPASWDEIHQYYAAQEDRLRKGGANDAEIRAYYGGVDPTQTTQDMVDRLSSAAGKPDVSQAQANAWNPFHDLISPVTGAAHEVMEDVRAGPGGRPIVNGVPLPFDRSIPDLLGLPLSVIGAPFNVAAQAGGHLLQGVPITPGGPGTAPAQSPQERERTWSNIISTGFWGLGGEGAEARIGGAATQEREAAMAAQRNGVGAADYHDLHTEVAARTTGQKPSTPPPTTEDFVDATVTMQGIHPGLDAARVRERLAQASAASGRNPKAIAQEAIENPVLRAQLLGEPNPPAAAGSARHETTPAPKGLNLEGAPQPDQFVIPRVVGSFDEAAQWMAKHEGGFTADTGGATNFGISQKANPDIDPRRLTQSQAFEIYHSRYWLPLGIDRLPPEWHLSVFDSGMNEGVAQTQAWLREAGGDFQKFMRLRVEKYASLVRQPQYAEYAHAWAQRLKDQGASDGLVKLIYDGKLHVGEPVSPEQFAAAGYTPEELDREGVEEGPPGEKPPKPPDPFGEDGSDDGKHWERVMGRTQQDKEPSWTDNAMQGVKSLYTAIFNPKHPINAMVDAVTEGRTLPDLQNPKILGRLAENVDTAVMHSIRAGGEQRNLAGDRVVGRALEDIVGDAGNQKAQQEFLDGYARARWALAMEEKNKKTGIDRVDAQKVVAEAEAKHPRWDGLFSELVGFRNNTMDHLVDGDAADPKLVEKLKEEDANIPGYRQMEDGRWAEGGGRTLYPIKRAKGSERPLKPLMQAMIHDAFVRRALAAHNLEAKAVADIGLEGGIAKQSRAINVNVLSALDDIKQAGISSDEGEWDDTLASLVKATGRQLGPDEVPVLRGGKLYGVKFEDRAIADALKGYALSPAWRPIMRVFSILNKLPRTMSTIANPIFAPKILGWDTLFQHIVNPDAMNPLKSTVGGLREMFTKGEPYDRWLASSGAERALGAMSKSAFTKDVLRGVYDTDNGPMNTAWNAARTGAHAFRAWASFWTGALKLGRFKQGLVAGETIERAAAASTSSAFHRPGFGGPVMRAMNTAFPFTSAIMSGLEQTTRALIGGVPEKLSGGKIQNRTVLGTPYNARQAWTRGFLYITAPTLLTWWAYKDQEWYKAAPDWQKAMAWTWIPPTGVTPPIPIPGIPLIQQIFGDIPRRMMNAFYEDEPDAFKHFDLRVSPEEMLSSSFLTPILEHLTNYSFFKHQPLVPHSVVDNIQPAEQYSHYSTTFARGVASLASDLPLIKDFKLSPPVVDNYIQHWGGMTDSIIGLFGRGSPGNGAFPERTVADWPLMSAWIERYPSASAQQIQDYYDRSDELTSLHGSLGAAIKAGDVADVKRLAERDPTAAALHMTRVQNGDEKISSEVADVLSDASDRADQNDLALIQEGQRAMKEASAYAQGVWEDTRLTGHDKLQILNMTYGEMQVMAERINEAMDRAHVGGRSPARNAQGAPGSIDFDEGPMDAYRAKVGAP